jgi:hypothetical protein
MYLINCIIYASTLYTSGRGVHAVTSTSYSIYVYNCTLLNFYTAIERLSTGTYNIKNCGEYNCTNWIAGSSGTLNETTNSTSDPVFVDAANGNYHLDESDTVWKNNGTNLYNDASYPFQDDIDGQERGEAWDIGADQTSPIYLGNLATIGGNYDSNDASYTFGFQFTCPGTVHYDLNSMLLYCMGTGNIRLAIYSSDKSTLIYQGSAEVAVGASVSWCGHTGISGAELVGGTTYWLCFSCDNNAILPYYVSGGTINYQVSSDFTGGFPASVTLGSSLARTYSAKIGITAVVEAISGNTCWGQITGATQLNIRTFSGNWTGTGSVDGTGDNERLKLAPGQYMESEVVQIGGTVEFKKNFYQALE